MPTDSSHLCTSRPYSNLLFHPVDGISITDQIHLYPAIRQVFSVAFNPFRNSRPLDETPEPDALYPTFHQAKMAAGQGDATADVDSNFCRLSMDWGPLRICTRSPAPSITRV